jgi:hypothetical protein
MAELDTAKLAVPLPALEARQLALQPHKSNERLTAEPLAEA